MAAAQSELPVYDITARKVHQWGMLLLLAIGFLAGEPVGAILVAVAGAIMLVGRFWWPADVVRQFTWRVLEPRGIVKRIDRHEDRITRRMARTLGGAIWLLSAVLIAIPATSPAGWVLTWLIGGMVALDATVDFCVLCFVFHQLEKRGLLPSLLSPSRGQLAAVDV
jgi:hypothetical protein